MTLLKIRFSRQSRFEVTKREFTIDTDDQKVNVEGHTHKNVALKYLMKRRRSLLMTKDPDKVESLYYNLPQRLKVMGKHKTHSYAINWEREGSTDFQGSRFVFVLQENSNV